jgi:protoporphyrinogen oxidase
MKNKLGIIGAGISGLSVGRLLKDDYDITILEKNDICGGIARTKTINGKTFHLTGGHCFNSKYQEVLDFVFKEVMPKEDWNLIPRKANIILKNLDLNYPIEFSIKDIYSKDPELAKNIIKDFIQSDESECDNLHDWFINNFGKTLADIYFIPYNEKIWKMDSKKMSPLWIEGKIPQPDKDSFINGLMSNETDKMPHRYFHYPKSNNQNTFIDSLESKIKDNIKYNLGVESIEKINNKWVVNKKYEFDELISTVPLNSLKNIIFSDNSEIFQEFNKLKYNKVSTLFWENDGNVKQTWTYTPDADSIFHRHIHIGNFMVPSQNTTITEAIGEYTKEEMIIAGKKFNYLKKPLDHHVSNHAYVVYDKNYSKSRTAILNYLKKIGLHTLGRFGEWEYYNMDVCIKSSIELSKKLKGK